MQAPVTSFRILACMYLPLLGALCGKGNKLTITAKITFLTIPRPPYGYRYFGHNCWMRMDSAKFTDLACALSFEEGNEFFDGDTADVELVFYNGEPLVESFEEGMI